MTAANYDGIVNYLNQPQQTVIDDIPEHLHPHTRQEDPDWRTPQEYTHCQLLVDRLPLFQKAFCMDVAVSYLTDRGAERVLRHSFPEILRMVSDMGEGHADRWWQRCRARLAFADVTTAELE